MSQKTIYTCDACQKEIGEKKHISLQVNSGLSGVAMPPDKKFLHWRIVKLPLSFMHFCSAKCMSGWFGGLLIKAK